MSDCIVISDDDSLDGSQPVGNSDLSSFREDELVNSRPGPVSALVSLLENDDNNIPDALGRIILNPAHNKIEDDIFVAFHIGKQLKSHQISGMRFMYSNLIGSISHFNADLSGSGCILAHSMGLGKTLQVVAFVEALFRNSKLDKVLIVTPANTIRLWYNEFNKWLPEKPPGLAKANNEDTELEGVVEVDEDDRFRNFNLQYIDDENKTFEDKLAIIVDWKNSGGVLLIGYEMLLSIIKNAKKRLQATQRKETSGGYLHLRQKQKETAEEKRTLMEQRKRELELLLKALFNPGPEIIVCDEGHRLKSENAEVVQLLRKVHTKRRLVLTGYPLQNNLTEYWHMVDFIRPGYLGPQCQFNDLFVAPIVRGSAADSVPAEVVLMRHRTHILYSLLKGFVHRRPALLLYKHLPEKYEFILSLKMTTFQANVYNSCVARCSMTGGIIARNMFRSFALAMKISNHPDVFHKFVTTRTRMAIDNEGDDDSWSGENEEDIVEERREKRTGKKASDVSARTPGTSASLCKDNGTVHDVEWSDWLAVAKRAGYQDESVSQTEPRQGAYDMKWAVPLLEGYTPRCNAEDSPKFRVLFCLIKHAILAGDRMLIFSQNLATLDLIEKILQKTIKPHAVLPNSAFDDVRPEENYWRHGFDYFRFDGSTPSSFREVLINRFQNTKLSRVKLEEEMKNREIQEEKAACSSLNASQVKLFLISTRAGSLGINLTGANRVCLMDASWNPCQDVQALSRVYRFGQLKPCFVYRLVSDCSLERVVYDRQIQKEALATRCVDDSPANRRFSREDLTNVYKHYPEDQAVPVAPPADNKEQFENLMASLNAQVVDTVLKSVIRELPHLFARAPQRHDTFREIDPGQRLSEQERRRAMLQYEVDKKEYELTMPVFTKNQRGKKRKPNEQSDVEDAASTSNQSRSQPPPTPRLTTEGLLSSLISSGTTAAPPPPPPSISVASNAPTMVSLLTGAPGRLNPTTMPPLPPPATMPKVLPSARPEPIAAPSPKPTVVIDSVTTPLSSLPLFALPPVPTFPTSSMSFNIPPSIVPPLPPSLKPVGPRGLPPPVMPHISELQTAMPRLQPYAQISEPPAESVLSQFAKTPPTKPNIGTSDVIEISDDDD